MIVWTFYSLFAIRYSLSSLSPRSMPNYPP